MAYELEQAKSQRLAAKTDDAVSSKMEAAEVKEGDEPKSAFDKAGFKAALGAKDVNKIAAQLNGLTAGDAKSIASDAELMGMIDGLDEGVRNSIYDKIYIGVEDSEALCQMILKRFNVAMGIKYSNDSVAIDWAKDLVGKNEKPWTTNGLLRMYALFAKLPASHIKKVKIVLTQNTQTGWYGGAAYSGQGVYYFDYTDTNCNTYLDKSEQFHGDFNEDGETQTINEANANYGLNYFDSTAAHELGHVVDFSQSKRYSDRPDFLEKTGWKEYKTFSNKKAVDEVVKDARSYIDRADPEEYAGDKAVSDIVDKIAKHMVKSRISSEDKIGEIADELLSEDKQFLGMDSEGNDLLLDDSKKRAKELLNYYSSHNHTWESEAAKNEYYMLQDKIDLKEFTNEVAPSAQKYISKNNKNGQAFVDSLKTAPLLQHIARANTGQDPWFHGEPFSNLSNRQIHSDYHGLSWFSYNVSARSNKISNYQFSTPAEEFAELYASYMVPNEADRKTPEPLKSWFEENVLKDTPPKQVIDAVNQGTSGGTSPSTGGNSGTVAGSGGQTSGSKDKDKGKKKHPWWQFWHWFG